MVVYNRFHCRLTIIRKTFVEKEEILSKSLYNVFFYQVPTAYISIGSAEESDIKIEGLLPLHCSFNFQNDSLVWYSYGENRFISQGSDVVLKEKELKTVPFSMDTAIEEGILAQWQIKILPFVYMEGVVFDEMHILAENTCQCLEDVYGSVEKIHEGKSCEIYLTKNNSLLKILSDSEILKKATFAKMAKSWQRISSKRLLKIENIVDVPFHICMENFPGESLENYYARKGILNYKDSLTILRSLLKSLKEMEGMESSYPVFLPEGILYSQGRTKIQSFHLSFPQKDFSEEYVPYLAPEYWQKKENAQDWMKGNIFSIAAIFYRFLTGKALYISRKVYAEAIEKKIFLDRYTLLRSSPRITPQLSELLESMLSFNPQDRISPQDALDFFSEISDVGVWASSLRLSQESQKETCRFGLEMVSSCGMEIKKVFPLEDNSSIVLGRIGDIEIANDSKVSKQHASLILKDGQAILKDMGSRNGTMVGGERIQECILPNGGSFVIGFTSFRFWDYGSIKETQKILQQKKEKPPVLQEILEDEEENTVDTQNYSIRSKKLQQIYETIEIPKIAKKSSTNSNTLIHRKDRIASYVRWTLGIAAILMISFAIVILYLSLFPGTLPKEKLPETFVTPIASKPSIALPIAEQPVPRTLTLEGKYLSEDRIKISGHYNGQDLELIVKTSQGITLYNQKIDVPKNSYEISVLLPHGIEYVDIFSIAEGKRESHRFLYPKQYKVNENLILAKDTLSFFLKKLFQDTQNFLTSSNIDALGKSLDLWEQGFEKKARQKISGTLLITQDNFGNHAASLLLLVQEMENLEYTLRSFLLYRKAFSPQATSMDTVLSVSGATSIYQNIEKLCLKIWNDKDALVSR